MENITPVRIQRKRIKGFRLPPNCIYVGRPTAWGNPYQIGLMTKDPRTDADTVVRDNKHAVDLFRFHWRRGLRTEKLLCTDVLRTLRGHDLACWCPLTYPDGTPYPCHADVLLELANA